MKNSLFLILVVLSCLNCSKKVHSGKLFTSLPSSYTNVSFSNTLNETHDWNIIKYLYYYNGGGVAIGDINNDNLPDIAFTANQSANKLYLNKGALQFEDVTEKANFVGNQGERAWKTGISMADVNGDGWLDIYVCQVGYYKNIRGINELYINQKNGTFKEMAAEYGLDFKGFSQQACWLDYDLDGDVDLFLVNHSVHSPESFVEAEKRNKRDTQAGDILFRNDNGKFINVSEEAGIYGGSMGFGLSATASDLNKDGWPDIYVANDFHENDYLYYNNGDGTFREGIKESIGHTSTFSMGSDIADLNNDGWMDIMTLDMKPESESILKNSIGADHHNLYFSKLNSGYHYQHPRNALQFNQGVLNATNGASFSETAQFSGIATTDWSWSVLAADFDNDGWKDIFITNGIWRRPNDLDYLKFVSDEEVQRQAGDLDLANKMPSGIVPNYAFKNLKTSIPTFQNVSQEWGLDLSACSNGAAYADLDNDGDLDLVVNSINREASIYENDANNQLNTNYLKIKFSNQKGSKFPTSYHVEINSNDLIQSQEIYPSRGWQSTGNYELVFGLGSAEKVNELTVRRGNKIAKYQDIPANQTFEILGTDLKREINDIVETTPFFKEIKNHGISFKHKENRFIDFNVEGLLPHQLSKEGPATAIGDVNGDGLEDVFIGGAKAQEAGLFIQKNTVSVDTLFEQKNCPAFSEDKMHEDVAATFFDADNDGDLDLYVVSGGGEYPERSKLLKDRIYFNDGTGNFVKKESSLPEFALNGSSVVAVDFNEDGTLDLFIGSRSVPRSYGSIPESVLLINKGKGDFEKIELANNGKFGMITDLAYLDSEKLLVVAGEWMPITFYKFENNNLSVQTSSLSENHGWWNALHISDIDKDGDQDILAGNLGLNTNLPISDEEPVSLYLADFDENYQTDPLMTYIREGKEWTVFGKDDIAAQLNVIKKRFTDYQSFSTSSFKEVMGWDENSNPIMEKRYINYPYSVLIENKGDGNYELKPLPNEVQLSPIQAFLTNDFSSDNSTDILAVGNFFANHPILGKFDASYGHFLKGDGKGSFDNIKNRDSGFSVFGDARHIKMINKKLILIVTNNGDIQVFKQ